MRTNLLILVPQKNKNLLILINLDICILICINTKTHSYNIYFIPVLRQVASHLQDLCVPCGSLSFFFDSVS